MSDWFLWMGTTMHDPNLIVIGVALGMWLERILKRISTAKCISKLQDSERETIQRIASDAIKRRYPKGK